MFKSVMYKEWIKTQWYIIAIGVIFIALHTYMFMKLGRSIRFAGMEHLWDVIINREQFVFRELQYFPLLAGIVIGLAQFVPEIYQKRLKLALHLPLPSFKIISWNILYGLILLISIFSLCMIILFLYMRMHFAYEFLESAFLTILPWYLAGLVAYLLVAWVCLEPKWDRRIINILVSCPLVYAFMQQSKPAAYGESVSLLLLIPIALISFVYISVIRFKEGK